MVEQNIIFKIIVLIISVLYFAALINVYQNYAEAKNACGTMGLTFLNINSELIFRCYDSTQIRTFGLIEKGNWREIKYGG